MSRMKVSDTLKTDDFVSVVNVKGWVRNKRQSKNVAFITINDGSSIHGLQIVVDIIDTIEPTLALVTCGAAIVVTGKLCASEGSGQQIELKAMTIEVIGEAKDYPLQPKKHSLEYLREIAHLRFRTNTFGAVFRIRHALTFAIHQFFNDRGFFNIHTPIITGSDCEGAGEMFKVTTLDLKNIPTTANNQIDYSQDFFGKETNLTVSGQLEAELAALGLSQVYTFGPTFRAENSNTSRHLAEFWMIEPEVAFADLNDNIELVTEFLTFLISYALEHCKDDLLFLSKRQADEEKTKKQELRSMELVEKLTFVLENDFVTLSYSEAIDILINSKPNKKRRFKFIIDKWGCDLQSEHEKYLVENHFKKPVIVTDYPAAIKAFYMRQNDDNKTVRAMDVLFPGIGEIVGGSQREERLSQLLQRMETLNIATENIDWYLQTRRFGSVPHSGFGLGFERFVQFVTGMSNIRDVIPFPRTPKSAEF